MTDTHTPGPWTVSKPSGNYIDGGKGRSIAALMYCATPADAHLMAAAPDMLAALEMVHRVLSCENVHSPLVESELRDIESIIARAKAVQS